MILGAVLWGVNGPSARFVQEHMGASPLDLGVYRAGLATIALGVLVRARPRINGRRDWLRACVIGFAIASFQLLFFAAIQLSSVTVATLVTFGLGSIFTAIGESVISRTPPHREVLLALMTSLAGLVLLVGGGEPSAGAALAALGGLLFATSTLVSRSLIARVPSADLNLAVSATASAVLLPAAVVHGLAIPDNSVAWAGVVFLGVSATVAFGLTVTALRLITATEAAIIAMLEPLTAALIAAMLFDERLGPVALAGALLMLGSVAALFRPAPKRAPRNQRL
jgi:drug/metabolite transporter, DME family